MCGIIGYIGKNKAAPILLKGIKKLEYRGYDSVGMVTQGKYKFNIKKDIGEVEKVNKNHNFLSLKGNLGMAHTRWATHGGVKQINSHPHISQNKKIVAVHNGIIENYSELKKYLELNGYNFITQTDTEIIPNYIELQLKLGKEIPEIISNFLNDVEGTFAILFMIQGENKLYAIRRDSPLVFGKGNNENYIASDIYAFSENTNNIIFFDNNEWAVIDNDKYQFFNEFGKPLNKEAKKIISLDDEVELGFYKHFMIKEIMDEPRAVKRILNSLQNEQKENFNKIINLIKISKKIVFVAAGTSYNASLLGSYYLNKCNIETHAIIASEHEYLRFLDKNSLVIALSQSGETMDVIDALKISREKGAKIVSIVNVEHSTIQRMSDISINTLAGQEISVASTKSFVNQALVLLNIAKHFGFDTDFNDLAYNIQEIFKLIPKIKNISSNLTDKKDLYVLGKGVNYPVSREIALKIKEVCYIHAESLTGGELKHGTIALIEEDTTVITLVHEGDLVSNLKEVEARGANIISIGSEKESYIILSSNDEGQFPILSGVIGQLLTYFIALEKGLPIDKPRNLAKCVTVR